MIFNRLKEFNNVLMNLSTSTQYSDLSVDDAFSYFKYLIEQINKKHGMVYAIGNGGSAGIASHFCNDLLKGLKVASNTLIDSNIFTCLANDYGYEFAYSEALKVVLKPQDLLICISSSGQSLNIRNAAKIAKEKNAKVVSLSGFNAINPLRSLGDLNFWLDSSDYGIVEIGHAFILHAIIDLFKKIESKNIEFTLAKR